MENRESYLEFITSENYKHQIDVWFKAYNINWDKIEMFYDFLSSLYQLIDETYLGVEVINDDNTRRNHFDWCWDKTISNFEKERIYFKNRGDHYTYFSNFFIETFYMVNENGEKNQIEDYLYKLFSFKQKKTRSELDILTDLYKLLNRNLKK